jgi:hypothetical protein
VLVHFCEEKAVAETLDLLVVLQDLGRGAWGGREGGEEGREDRSGKEEVERSAKVS